MPDVAGRLTAALAGRYVIEREIGHGGMATVHLARDAKHGRAVAIKVLRPELTAAIGADRFLREIAIAAQLQNPYVLPLIESGEADGLLFYLMPFVESESLRSRLTREGTLASSEATRLLRDIVEALAHAYRHGVVHRDLKPDNVMIAERMGSFSPALAVPKPLSVRLRGCPRHVVRRVRRASAVDASVSR